MFSHATRAAKAAMSTSASTVPGSPRLSRIRPPILASARPGLLPAAAATRRRAPSDLVGIASGSTTRCNVLQGQ